MALLDRNRIVEAVDLEVLADELLGPRRGSAQSPCWPCPSPNHAQTGRTPPVTVFRSRQGEERWHCHGCGIGGSAIDLVIAVRGVPVRDALEELAFRARLTAEVVTEPPRRAGAPRRRELPACPVGDLGGLQSFVEQCAEHLWRPQGRVVLRWLTGERGLPEDVLLRNRVGADRGRRAQSRPDGMPSAGRAAVLPVYQDGQALFAQLRPLMPLVDGPRYLNAPSRLAPNPRVGFYEPAATTARCVIVTEGVIDALSATTAGFRAAAVLGASLAGGGGGVVADRLAGCGSPLVVAFDADEAGDRAAKVLCGLLRDRDARVSRLHVPPSSNDLNAWMRRSPDWNETLRAAVRSAVIGCRPPRALRR